ncbi:MAG: hypothetical protein QOJ79_2203 [Actinomycetota bacterium]|nr:hypothetical protein [Actinomycetota bacterium]
MVHDIHGKASMHPLPGGRYYLAFFGCLLLVVYVARALQANERAALRWLSARGLVGDERLVGTVRDYLRRLRWARVGATALFVGMSALSVWALQWPLGFITTPYLICLLVAESLSPAPRRGRLRTALVDRRDRSYFAPALGLACARLALWSGAAVALAAPSLTVLHRSITAGALLHAGLMLVAAAALEVSLDRITRRALPDRAPDLQIDTAIRVASARIATAAGLAGGSFGLLLSLGFIGRPLPAPMLTGQLINLGMAAALGGTIALLIPLRMWRPRSS